MPRPAPPPTLAFVLALAVALLTSACLYDTGASYVSGPTEYPSVEVDPAPFDTVVAVNPQLALRFDRHLDPFQVDPLAAVRLTTGRRRVELDAWWDPVDRALYATPTEPLKPGVRYVLEVVAPSALPDLGGRTPDAALVEALRTPFTVDPAGVERDSPAPDLDESNPESEFRRLVISGPGSCTICHTTGSSYPGAELALDDLAALVNRPALTAPARTLVIPGQPERSYLLHKLLDDYPDIGGLPMPLGMGMSPDDRRSALRATQLWIRALPAL